MADQQSEQTEVPSQIQDTCDICISDDELDIHVCGKCKASFTDLTAYIEHKKSKICTKAKDAQPPVVTSTSQSQESTIIRHTIHVDKGDDSDTSTKKSVVMPLEVSPGNNKVVVELLDPVDVSRVITDTSVIVQGDINSELQVKDETPAAKPKRRHKRKNSTPKTTRKTVAAAEVIETAADVDEESNTVTVHIPQSQLVHLGASGESSATDVQVASVVRKQEATSVFVPIYLTNPKKTFKCSKCPAEFRSKEERCSHGSLHKKHFKCTDCSKRYYTMEALDAHRVHETHIHTCDRCNKVFHSQVYLKRHLAVHIEERNFACDICLKTYTSMANCRAHKRSVHAVIKKHVCDECGKAFARKDKLKRHQLIHIPYPNRPVFPCPFRSHTGCTSTFYREDKLKRHLFTHSKEKPYKCEQCDKGFARRDNLNDHMKTHTKDFSYVCTLCQRGFLGPAKLKKHLKAVHPDEDYDVETLVQKAREAPTMASLKNTIPQGETVLQPGKALETQVNVGLDVVNQAICCQSAEHIDHDDQETEASDQDESGHQDKEVTMETQEDERLITISQPLPPAPPLIHQVTSGVSSDHITIPSGSVFIPRIALQHGAIYSRDMVTIPNELLSMVHGLNS